MFNAHHHDRDIESILFHHVRPHTFISDALANALCAVDRVPFLPPAYAHVAYADAPIQLKRRTEFPFFILARMLHALDIKQHEHACVLSAGTGYSATVLSKLCAAIDAFENDSVLFARLIDATRHEQRITPLSVLGKGPVNVILMDGGSVAAPTQHQPDTHGIPDVIANKLLPRGRLAYVRAHTDHHDTNGMAHAIAPLCDVIIHEKGIDDLFLPPRILCQMHMPILYTHRTAS